MHLRQGFAQHPIGGLQCSPDSLARSMEGHEMDSNPQSKKDWL